MAKADEITERQAFTHHIQELYAQKNYEALNQIYQDALIKQTRTASGIWVLRQLYDSFGAIFKTISSDDDSAWHSNKDNINQWIKQNPNIVLPKILYAKLLERRAWAYRGAGLASKVTPEGWARFRKLNQENKSYLKSIKETTSQDPEWYVSSLNNASFMQIKEESYTKLLKEATLKHPLYYSIYFDAINFHYLPKWGGSKEDMEHLANYAVSKTKSMEGDALYSRIYWVISADSDLLNLKSTTNVNWERMKKSMDTVLKQYPAEWNYTHFALISCRAQDKEQTAKLFEFIPNFNQNNWEFRGNYNYCKSYATDRLKEYFEKLGTYEEKKMEYFVKVRGNLDYLTNAEYLELEKQFEAQFGPLTID